jgi:hypothetical protein
VQRDLARPRDRLQVIVAIVLQTKIEHWSHWPVGSPHMALLLGLLHPWNITTGFANLVQVRPITVYFTHGQCVIRRCDSHAESPAVAGRMCMQSAGGMRRLRSHQSVCWLHSCDDMTSTGWRVMTGFTENASCAGAPLVAFSGCLVRPGSAASLCSRSAVGATAVYMGESAARALFCSVLMTRSW